MNLWKMDLLSKRKVFNKIFVIRSSLFYFFCNLELYIYKTIKFFNYRNKKFIKIRIKTFKFYWFIVKFKTLKTMKKQ